LVMFFVILNIVIFIFIIKNFLIQVLFLLIFFLIHFLLTKYSKFYLCYCFQAFRVKLQFCKMHYVQINQKVLNFNRF
jgi:hypothetical protein